MELPDLGDCCDLTGCNKLDFLPFCCEFCFLTFCSDHRQPKLHSCEKYSVEETRVADFSKGESISYLCSFVKGCKNKELTQVICPKCHNNFCLAHRHPPDHECAQWLQEEQTSREKHKKSEPTKVALNQRPLRNAKARQTAAKVALMKMKLHADGDKTIPQTERLYLWLALPRNSFRPEEPKENNQSIKDKPMFFCCKWTLGRMIDDLASRLKLHNANNVASARKLRLFRHEDGRPLTPLSQTLEEVVHDSVIFSGSPVIVEYVDPDQDEVFVPDPSLYLL